MKLIFCMQISMKAFYKLILWFWWWWSSISKVSRIANLQCLYNISKKKLEIKLIFCMQINIKVSYKFISTLWASKFSTRLYYHNWLARSSILKVLKVTSLRHCNNISKKVVRDGVRFLHVDKLEIFYRVALSFLIEVVRHV